MSKIGAALASLGCFIAGVYLLTTHSLGTPGWFDALAHGIGIYFLAKGFFVGASLMEQIRSREALETLLQWRQYENEQRETDAAAPE
jgi:CRISPR/Cas system-associated endonuclease Cas1